VNQKKFFQPYFKLLLVDKYFILNRNFYGFILACQSALNKIGFARALYMV